jgi:hypothetical protein
MTEWIKGVGKAAIRHILAVLITCGCFAMLYFLVIKAIPETNKDVVLTAVGFVFGQLGVISGYFFGASKGDEKKGED